MKNTNKIMKEKLKNDLKSQYDKKDRGGVKGAYYLDLSDPNVSRMRINRDKNAIDIIPFIHATDLVPGKRKGDPASVLDIYIHKRFNQKFDQCVCLQRTFGKPCPICEERQRLRDLDEKEHEDRIAELQPKRRSIMNVINLKEDEEDEHNGQIQIFDEVYFFFMKELLEESMDTDTGEFIDFTDPQEGKTVLFRASQEKFYKASFYKFKSFSFMDRDEPYEYDIMDYSYSNDLFTHGAFPLDKLLIVPTYQEVEAMLNEGDVEEEEDEEQAEPPAPKASVKTKRKVVEEPEEDEEDDEEELEDEESEDNKCPYGHTFGDDNMETDDCAECRKKHPDTFKDCVVANVQ